MRAPRLDISDNQSVSSDTEEWDFVPMKSGRSHHVISHHQLQTSQVDDTLDNDFVIKAVMETVTVLSNVLGTEDVLNRYSEYLLDTAVLVAYGIGSISNSVLSRFQLALLVAIRKHTKCTTCLFFDPVVSVSEKAILDSLGIKAAQRDCDLSPFSCDKKVLFFMPHCDRELYEWVLQHKLSPDSKAVFVSNLFSNYTIQYTEWESIISHFSEELLLIFKSDYSKYKSGKDRFNPKTAERSQVIPFAAFNDLAFITIDGSQHDLISKTLAKHLRSDS